MHLISQAIARLTAYLLEDGQCSLAFSPPGDMDPVFPLTTTSLHLIPQMQAKGIINSVLAMILLILLFLELFDEIPYLPAHHQHTRLKTPFHYRPWRISRLDGPPPTKLAAPDMIGYLRMHGHGTSLAAPQYK